jgi:VanZ family protein
MRRLILEHRWALRLLWFGLGLTVIFLSLLPAESRTLQAIASIVVNDKAEHIVAYAPLAFLPTLHEMKRTALICILMAMLAGIALEFGQLHVHGRSFDVFDMMANGVGLMIGGGLASVIRSALRIKR